MAVWDSQGSTTVQFFDSSGGAGDHILHDTEGETGSATIVADLTNATAATINELRLAFQTQRLLERDARSGLDRDWETKN